MTLNELLPRLKGVSGSGKQYSARCPAHDDKRASLSISEGTNGKILLNCHAGCAYDDIVAALGLQRSDLFQQPTAAQDFAQAGKATLTAEYVYTDLNGIPVAKKLRYSNKEFCWLKPDGAGWTKGRGGQAPLFNCFHVKDKSALYIVEGEKDVLTLSKYGKAAVSLPDGAKSKWLPEYGDYFKGKSVAIIEDHDKPGKAFAQTIAEKLNGIAESVRVIDLSKIWAEIPEHGDITDYVESHTGTDLHELSELVSSTEVWTSEGKGKKLKTISSTDLQKANLPPVQFLVERFLPEGTSMISAPPKIGKSWFVLDLGLSIAKGMPFLERSTNRAGVLYLALEDSLNRLQDRMNKILDGAEAPTNFDFATEAPNLDNGFFEALEETLKDKPNIKLVIIDTLQKIRGVPKGRESAYGQDYREMGALKSFMDRHGVSVLFVHHTRKMKDLDDPFNMISGTQGIMGAADTAFTLLKAKREDEGATLHVTGRDVEQISEIVKFNKEIWKWETVGDARVLEEQKKRQAFERNPITVTVVKLIEESPQKRWDGTASELMEQGKRITGMPIAPTLKKLGWTLKSMESDFYNYSGVIFEKTPNGNAGKVYHFYSA